MAEESVASIIPWQQPRSTNMSAKAAAEAATKPEIKARAKRAPAAKPRKQPNKPQKTKAAVAPDDEARASESRISPDFLELVREQSRSASAPERARVDWAGSPRPASPAAAPRPALPAQAAPTASLPAVTSQAAPLPAPPHAAAVPATTPMAVLTPMPRDEPVERHSASSLLLRAAALALAAVGMAMNGWFAHSLGSNEAAGWMFLAIGVTADLVALIMPTCAARLWHARQRTTALAGWTVWIMTFVFAVTASIGFTSVNISEVGLARASRQTPAVQSAQVALTDAMAARDRECKGGVGRFCREREAAVTERRQALDAAMASVGHTADPQTDAAIKLAACLSHGTVNPTADDFAMLRLVLLALLPQLGGILLMVGRRV